MPGVRRARVFFTAMWLVMQAALLISPSIVLRAAAHEENAARVYLHAR